MFVSTQSIDANLVRTRGATAPAIGNVNPVLANLFDLHRIEMRDNVRIVISRCLGLIEQLGGYCAYRNQTAGSWMFGNSETAIGLYFCDGIPHISEARYLFKERIITAAALGAAFDNMPCG